MKSLEELIEIERQLWRNDPDYCRKTYLPDAILIFPEIGRLTTAQVIETILEESRQGQRWTEVHLEDIDLRPLASGAVLLSYRAQVCWNNENIVSILGCATVYVQQAGAWKVAFQQQTPVLSSSEITG